MTYSNSYIHSYTDGGGCHEKRRPAHQEQFEGSVSCPRTLTCRDTCRPGESNERPSDNKTPFHSSLRRSGWKLLPYVLCNWMNCLFLTTFRQGQSNGKMENTMRCICSLWGISLKTMTVLLSAVRERESHFWCFITHLPINLTYIILGSKWVEADLLG